MMSWAVTLSGYSGPAAMPTVSAVSHFRLSQDACAGRECKVMGWFPPGATIYLDERLDVRNDLYASSILVHEMVHYLQQESKKYAAPYTCDDAIKMEHEAYAVQREYILRYGDYMPVGISMHSAGCIPSALSE
jgi:hypothetical protein